MTVVLQDPVRPRNASSRHAFPAVEGEGPLLARPTLADELRKEFLAGQTTHEITFAVESRGGYARSVSGTVAYLDGEANTFMVRDRDGAMIRVPLRDIKSVHPTT